MALATWGADALARQLGPLVPGIGIEIVPSCGSTNTLLLDRARRGDARPCLLVAQEQTHGRGRQGRAWISSPGASLTFSLALPLAPRDWLGLSLAVGVALADALDPAGAAIGLKWPNDLWLRLGPGYGRKLGGVLIETVAAAGQRVCIVGVGLNVLPQSAPGLTTGYASLYELDPRAGAAGALATVALPLVLALQRFEGLGFTVFGADFARRDLLHGQRISTTSANVPEGWAEGVDDQGSLLVRSTTLHRLASGEVSVRPLSPPAQAARC